MAKPPGRKPRGPVQKLSVYLDPVLYRDLRIAAFEDGEPTTRVIERLIRGYLADRKRKKR